MKGLSEEERRQREKEERSRQRLQDQAYREAQRAVFARIYGEHQLPEEEDWDPVWDEDPRDRSYDPPRPRKEKPWAATRLHRRVEDYDTLPNRPKGWEEDVEQPPAPPKEKKKRPQGPAKGPGEKKRPSPKVNPLHPEEKPPSKERPSRGRNPRRRILAIALAFLALLLLLGLAAHAIFVHRPELSEGEGVHPTLLEAGRKEDVYTFLLAGRDSGGGGNTDTIMVGCYDVKNGTLDVMSLYRDTLVDVPWEIKKINSVYNHTGMEGLREEVRDLIGYAPDYYFLLELDMVAQLVDAMGGVDYDIPFAMHYDDPTQDLHIHFEPGMQHLNGEDAVKVLRWRQNNSGELLSVGDVGRVELQHAFLSALMDQALSLGTLLNIGEIIGIVDENLSSNLSYGEMLWFGEKFLAMDKAGLVFHTMPGDVTGSLWSDTYQNYQSYVFVNDGALRDIINTYMNPYTTDITPDMQHVIYGTTVDNLSGNSYAPVG